MPPRAQRLYPRMRERPPEFRVNEGWPLYHTINLFVTGHQSRNVIAASPMVLGVTYNRIDQSCRCVWNAHIRRFGIKFINTGLRENIEITYKATAAFPTGTVIAWILHPDALDENGPVYFGNPPNEWWQLRNGITFMHGNVGVSVPSLVLPSQQSYCIVATHYRSGDNEVRLVYINGRLDGNATGYIPNPGNGVWLVGSWTSDSSWRFRGILSDVLFLSVAIDQATVASLSDPSNVDLRIGGVPLILSPRRRLWPVVPVAEYVKRRQLGLRVGSREAIT